VWISALDKLDTLKNPDSFQGWITVIAANAVRNTCEVVLELNDIMQHLTTSTVKALSVGKFNQTNA
jgi:DNA-directed RNA polymerase specialized sigma24 family protein